MQEKQQVQFYDKLLQCLNKTFLTNLKTQQLYLDLTKNTRQLRFKSIKAIYTTITDGKADEVIFNKDKPKLLSFQSHNQLKTQRTCWRLIQKLITKVAYFLTNERGLKDLGPTILKAVGFARKAVDKINTKISFLQFFSEVIDLLNEENNILEKKIYNILIQRGYIYSADEFYRLSRFQNNADYTYAATKRSNTEDLSEIVDVSTITKTVPHQDSVSKSRTRRGTFSANKLFKNRTSVFYHFSDSNKPSEDDQKSQVDIEDISEKTPKSSSSIEVQQQCMQKTNKLNHELHEQVDKVIDQLVHHPHYQFFLESLKQQAKSPESPKRAIKASEKEPVIKQIIKNIRLKKFKANQQLLQIKKQDSREDSQQKNYSQSKLKQSLTRSGKKRRQVYLNKRTSIATAISKRIQQNWFKSTGLYDVQELVINNLTKYNSRSVPEDIQVQENKQPQRNVLRHKKRLQTQNIEFRPAPILHQQQYRKSTNMHFLSNAFVFKTGQNSNNLHHYRTNTFGPDLNYVSHSSINSYQSGFSNKHNDHKKSQFGKNRQQKQILGSFPQKDHHISKFARNSKIKLKKIGDNNKKQFNTAFLQFAARKYNRYSTQENYLSLGQNLQDLINLHSIVDQDLPHFLTNKNTRERGPKRRDQLKGKDQKIDFHKKRYEIFDRRNNRVL